MHGKRVADWNWMIKLRRMIGLLSFFYATTHLGIYFWLDQGADILGALSDMTERPFIAVGIFAFVLLVPLALTANNYSMRLLKKSWRRLHRTVYLIAILAIIHFWMLTKVGVNDPLPYTLITIVLLGWRVWFAWMPRKGKILDHGMEMPERHSMKT
jgi:sulfoxide reductase heme-binding subunit YedZ